MIYVFAFIILVLLYRIGKLEKQTKPIEKLRTFVCLWCKLDNSFIVAIETTYGKPLKCSYTVNFTILRIDEKDTIVEHSLNPSQLEYVKKYVFVK